ncbi:hypothetical protein JCM33374_g2412 [Metschnikowia sp. JCM 33374]|nr:hypothetical protein JCM33374_g2412 [Metschnikowia sp. JCM 33374]
MPKRHPPGIFESMINSVVSAPILYEFHDMISIKEENGEKIVIDNNFVEAVNEYSPGCQDFNGISERQNLTPTRNPPKIDRE